jgi:formylglycine-generating enzyme required for sulfatase activity
MGVFEVQQGEYEKVMKHNPSAFKVSPKHPVESVSWEDAMEFCKRLSDLADERKAGRTYRLPTEAEWEYACRGGDHLEPFHFGRSLSSAQANFDGRFPYGDAPVGANKKRTEKVGSYQANGFGLHDMHGNVAEWCLDWYDANYYGVSPQQDPQGPGQMFYRVLRGGSFLNKGKECRAADRQNSLPDFRGGNQYGFRVVLIVVQGNRP